MRIELATVEDVPELQELQRKASASNCSGKFSYFFRTIGHGSAPASKFRRPMNFIFAKGSDHIKMKLLAQD
jgi:hypothetical protein